MNNVLLYGKLSEKIHLPRLYCLYLPSDMPSDQKEFYLELYPEFLTVKLKQSMPIRQLRISIAMIRKTVDFLIRF